MQRVRQILTPPGEARPDWWITQELGKRLAQALGRPWVLQLHPARGNPLRGIPPHPLHRPGPFPLARGHPKPQQPAQGSLSGAQGG
ncbi:hypothetical protein ABTN89_17875, partial [Acinetobacter baumannii]